MFLFWIILSLLTILIPVIIVNLIPPYDDFVEFLKFVSGIGIIIFCITLVIGVSMYQESLDTMEKIEYIRTEFQNPCTKFSNNALSIEVIDFNETIIDWKANGSNWRSGLIIPNKALEVELIK